MICSEWYFETVIRNLTSRNKASEICHETILKYHERYLQYAKYHLQIILLFVYTATRQRFAIFTWRYSN